MVDRRFDSPEHHFHDCAIVVINALMKSSSAFIGRRDGIIHHMVLFARIS